MHTSGVPKNTTTKVTVHAVVSSFLYSKVSPHPQSTRGLSRFASAVVFHAVMVQSPL